METKQKSLKKYCVASGCFKTSRKNQELSFFSLPKDVKRRRHWLKLIGREDLLLKEDLKHRSYELCSDHFDDSAIKIVRHLTKDAVPTKLLHNQPKRTHKTFKQVSVETQTQNSILLNKGTQTQLGTKCDKEVKSEIKSENDLGEDMDSEIIENAVDIKDETKCDIEVKSEIKCENDSGEDMDSEITEYPLDITEEIYIKTEIE